MLMPEVKLKLPAQVLLGAHFREVFGKVFGKFSLLSFLRFCYLSSKSFNSENE